MNCKADYNSIALWNGSSRSLLKGNARCVGKVRLLIAKTSDYIDKFNRIRMDGQQRASHYPNTNRSRGGMIFPSPIIIL